MPASTMIIAGLVLFATGFALMSDGRRRHDLLDAGRHGDGLAAWASASSIPASTPPSLKALPADKVRQGAGVANFMRQLGGAFGINLLVAFFEVRTALPRRGADRDPGLGQPHHRSACCTLVEQLHAAAAACPSSSRRRGAYEYLGTMLHVKAQMLAFSDTFIVIGVVALLALIPAAMLSRSQRRSRRLAFS